MKRMPIGREKPSTRLFAFDARAGWWLLGVLCGLVLQLQLSKNHSGAGGGWLRQETAAAGGPCAIPYLHLGFDKRFATKAEELVHRISDPRYPSFEELYGLVMNEPYDDVKNVWKQFPNPYGMQPNLGFPFSNLRPAHVEKVLAMLGRPPKLAVEVGSFHGNSAIMTASVLDHHHFQQTPLVCIDPWTGDLGELLYRDDWQKKITPGEIRDGRSTSYYQFMLNVKSKIEEGAISSKHIIPLAVTSDVGARYLTALQVTPDFVYLDSAHEPDTTYMELTLYYALLSQGGVIFGDDFTWESVRNDVLRFASEKKLELQQDGVTWMLQKPK